MIERVRGGGGGETEAVGELVVDLAVSRPDVEVAAEDQRRAGRPIERALGGPAKLGLGARAIRRAGAGLEVGHAYAGLGPREGHHAALG